ncbi:GntR family transcriptional regulator [Carnobacterium sp. ISL-102]|uniref:GntR family transcriptional regulator n=1 Tax=Carnobacterium sp. ISL-102 TaxID=2819142 RepID=UPI001BEADC6F|nr:GntR family transcriptional regulator [Carnobacterium sp. ISL-102]MBT2733081.1 GntR family transcriptional regulator [Carnobacterium sp. ISL-102]
MGIPKYQQVKDDLLKKIEFGEFKHGDRFYSEVELVKIYNVSSITVIRAVQELVNAGYLIRFQGKGTYVSRSRKRKLIEFSDIEIYAGEPETVEVLSLELQNDEDMRKKLQLRKKENYYEIIRLRKVDEDPFLLHLSYIPSQFIKKDIPSLDYYDSIYNRFKSDFDIYMYDEESKETNEIRFPTDAWVAELLKMGTNEPTIRQEKRTILQDGTIAEIVVSYKKWNYYKIELSSFKNQY